MGNWEELLVCAGKSMILRNRTGANRNNDIACGFALSVLTS